MKRPLVTVVEHPNYLKRAEKLLTQEQVDEIANILAANPEAGDLMRAREVAGSFGMPGCREKAKAAARG